MTLAYVFLFMLFKGVLFTSFSPYWSFCHGKNMPMSTYLAIAIRYIATLRAKRSSEGYV